MMVELEHVFQLKNAGTSILFINNCKSKLLSGGVTFHRTQQLNRDEWKAVVHGQGDEICRMNY